MFDVPDDPNTNCFLLLLESMGLQQHVNKPTHEIGHILLDLVVTRQSEIVLDSPLIPHHLFSFVCSLQFETKENVIFIDSLKSDPVFLRKMCTNTPCVYKTTLAGNL